MVEKSLNCVEGQKYTECDNILTIDIDLHFVPKLKKFLMVFLGFFLLLAQVLTVFDVEYYDQYGIIQLMPVLIIVQRLSISFLIAFILSFLFSSLFLLLFNKSGKKPPHMVIDNIQGASSFIFYIGIMLFVFINDLFRFEEIIANLFSYQNLLTYYEGFALSVIATTLVIMEYGVYRADRKGKYAIDIQNTQIDSSQLSTYFFRKIKLDQKFFPNKEGDFQIGISQIHGKKSFGIKIPTKTVFLTREEFYNYTEDPFAKNSLLTYSVIIMYEDIEKDAMIPNNNKYGKSTFGANLGIDLTRDEVIELLELLQKYIPIEIVRPHKHDMKHIAPGSMKFVKNETRI